MDLWESISTLAGTRNQTNVICFYGTVTSVDIANRKCSISTLTLNATESNFDVDLCILGNTGLIIVPSIDSQVLVMYSKNVNPIVIQHSFIDKILLNGDENGGLVLANELKTQLDKTNQVVNALVQAITTWTPVAGDGGTALKVFATTQLTGKTVGDYSNIKSTTIFQG
jgi:hypothetical protein